MRWMTSLTEICYRDFATYHHGIVVLWLRDVVFVFVCVLYELIKVQDPTDC